MEITEGVVIHRQHVLWSVATIIVVCGVKKLTSYIAKQRQPNNIESKVVAVPLDERKPPNLWNTALFFPDYRADKRDSVAQQFLWYFAQAKTSIRVCIYNFKMRELESVIAQQYERGLIVQFIVGHQMTADCLRLSSIPCGVLPRRENIPASDQLMHHKFAIIDDEAVLAGSMNWTTDGILTNKENVAVSTNPNHVEKYVAEFFRLLGICEKARTYF